MDRDPELSATRIKEFIEGHTDNVDDMVSKLLDIIPPELEIGGNLILINEFAPQIIKIIDSGLLTNEEIWELFHFTPDATKGYSFPVCSTFEELHVANNLHYYSLENRSTNYILNDSARAALKILTWIEIGFGGIDNFLDSKLAYSTWSPLPQTIRSYISDASFYKKSLSFFAQYREASKEFDSYSNFFGEDTENQRAKLLQNAGKLMNYPKLFGRGMFGINSLHHLTNDYNVFLTSIRWDNSTVTLMTEFLKDQEEIVVWDFFSGKGSVPAYLLYWLVENNLTQGKRIFVNTVSIFENPDYTAEDLHKIIGPEFSERILKMSKARINFNHFSTNAFEALQLIKPNSASIVTLYNCSEAFNDPELYMYAEGYKGNGKDGIRDTRSIRDVHLQRILKPGGFLLQVAGSGIPKGIQTLGDIGNYDVEHQIVGRKPIISEQ